MEIDIQNDFFSTRVYEKHDVYPIFEENLDLEKLYKNLILLMMFILII